MLSFVRRGTRVLHENNNVACKGTAAKTKVALDVSTRHSGKRLLDAVPTSTKAGSMNCGTYTSADESSTVADGIAYNATLAAVPGHKVSGKTISPTKLTGRIIMADQGDKAI